MYIWLFHGTEIFWVFGQKCQFLALQQMTHFCIDINESKDCLVESLKLINLKNEILKFYFNSYLFINIEILTR